MRHAVTSPSTTAIGQPLARPRGAIVPAAGLAGPILIGLLLAGCAGGIADTAVNAPPPPTDLDTTRAPPQTVTQTPLLPPPPPDGTDTGIRTPTHHSSILSNEHLYTEDEQAQIAADLAAAAARAQR